MEYVDYVGGRQRSKRIFSDVFFFSSIGKLVYCAFMCGEKIKLTLSYLLLKDCRQNSFRRMNKKDRHGYRREQERVKKEPGDKKHTVSCALNQIHLE